MIFRVDVECTGADPHAESIRQQILEMGIDPGQVRSVRVFLIQTDSDQRQVERAAAELLSDPIVERASVNPKTHSAGSLIEIHLKPGVMDPVAASTEMALRDMGIQSQVRTGRGYRLERRLASDDLNRIATRALANGVIESIHFEPFHPAEFPAPRPQPFKLRTVPLADLADAQLAKLSREAHLFLSLQEMRAIQAYFRGQKRDPTDIELETLAQTWSEHCVHKTLKSAVEVIDQKGQVVQRYDNLIKETIFRATDELALPMCLSVFKDNAGVIAFDDVDAVCFKVETHNHPSAIEPYGGSATGVGGVIRDVLGTGLSARPVANTDVFCVAHPTYGGGTSGMALPRGIIHPKRILQQVVAGVRDYGNRMGIPTVNGAVFFDDHYLGNPLVFCGCVGLIPRNKIEKRVLRGDAIVLIGGRTGRDGIHGATFSSAELSDTHADEFSHAVQIGNAIEEKKVADVILQARDRGLFSAITDCGAGGLSSAVGEMAEKFGALVQLEKVPLKYAGLRYDEIWISEAQERMVLAVPQEKVSKLLSLCRGEDVEATVIGVFGTEHRELILEFNGQEVGRLSMEFLHDGLPMPTRKAILPEARSKPARTGTRQAASPDPCQRLLQLLAHPNIASKHWIIRQYDHEVQGGSVIKPLTGRRQLGPSDAAVVRPKLDSDRAVVIACGMAPQIEDPYQMSIASIDEAIRNAVCVGADLSRLAVLDNFCWPSVDDEQTMGTLVAACQACYDAAKAFGVPFISGKDSLHNQFTNQETGKVLKIPRTLLISAIGVIDDARRCIGMDLKMPGDGLVCMVASASQSLADLARTHRAVASAISSGKVLACHDVSEGGWLVAAAEMCIGSGYGLKLDSKANDRLFDEENGSYLIEIPSMARHDIESLLAESGARLTALGKVTAEPVLEFASTADRAGQDAWHVEIDQLTRAWRGTLDF
jgi:phosphoribosylformylglycinamidine synthase